ncbi:MAG: hypothetical protein CMJ18_04790 [Phycisphaeraceae bacterium]|nr:hypothetical protein [Phycisphaeraceae bacterium]
MMDIDLSPYGQASTRPSPVNRMMSAFAGDFREGHDVNLGVGYVNERTIPRGLIRAALDEVLDRPEDYRAPFNYGGPAGAPYLVSALRDMITGRRVGGLTAADLERRTLVVGASGATSLLDGLGQVLTPGIVLTSDPNYYIYGDVLQRRGFQVRAVPEDADGIEPQRLADAIDKLGAEREAVRFVYVVTVNNPTCTILGNERRRDLVEVVTDLGRRIGRKVPLVCDTAYEWLIHDPQVEAPRSMLLDDPEGIVHELGTLSKVLAPALRIGFMIASPSPLTEAMVQNVSDVGFSAPLANQAIASRLLETHLDEQLASVNAGYRHKAAMMRQWIDEHLGAHLESCRGGRAGFYYYLTFRRLETTESSAFFRFLARTTGRAEIDGTTGDRRPRVIYIPGQFCVQPDGEMVEQSRRQLRLSYGFEQLDRIEPAIRMMGEAAAYAEAATCSAATS